MVRLPKISSPKFLAFVSLCLAFIVVILVNIQRIFPFRNSLINPQTESKYAKLEEIEYEIVDKGNNWQTFVSQNYNFKIDYPKDFSFTFGGSIQPGDEYQQVSFSSSDGKTNLIVAVNIGPNQFDSLEEKITYKTTEDLPRIETMTISPDLIGDINGYVVKVAYHENYEGTRYYLQSNDDFFELSAFPYSNRTRIGNKEKDLVQRMISSFEVID